jgi:hypothetical protein
VRCLIPQIKPEYEAIDDFKTIALKLVDKYPEFFNGINANEIKCVGITNKDPKDGKDVFDIMPVPMPIRMDCAFSYYAICNMQDWMGMDRKHQQVEVFRVLSRISPENDGRVLPFDLKDVYTVVKNFGPDYRRVDVPDILAEGFSIKKD